MPDLELIALLTARLKQLEARLPSTVADAVSAWAQANRDSLRGEDGQSISDEQIKSAAAEWLVTNIRQPVDGNNGQDGKDAEPITDQQIQFAVNLWLEINKESLRGADGKDGADGRHGLNGKDGADGRNGPDGKSGQDGKDGVGIADIYQQDATTIVVLLTDGSKKTFKLPQSIIEGGTTIIKRGGGGGGIEEVVAGDGIAVDNTDPRRPIISATGGGGGSIQKFEVALSGFSYQVTQTQHGLSDIMIRVTRDADGALVSVADAIGLDGLVNIESNTSLSGHTLTLIGVTSNGS